jgi:predicted AlkP superfamily pyrophosphatase or phosphodiesterase
MRRIRLGCFIIVVWLFLSTAWASFLQGNDTIVSPAKRTVVVISLDGFPAWALQDPRLPVPTLHRLEQQGAVATRMTVANPSYTWPNHATLMTGQPPAKHGVLVNGVVVREGPDRPVKEDASQHGVGLVRVPTILNLAQKAGLTTAAVDWPVTGTPKAIDWEFPENPNPKGIIEQEMLSQGTINQADIRQFMHASPMWRDQVWTEAAVDIIAKHRPNLLLFHLLNLDAINHFYGPGTFASYTAFAAIDCDVQKLLTALEAAGLARRTTVFVVSDHGFEKVRRVILLNALLRQHGLLKQEDGKIYCKAYVDSEGGCALVYITDPKDRAVLLPQLEQIFRNTKGIEHVFLPGDYASLGLPTPKQNHQSPDLFLVAKDVYSLYPNSHVGPAERPVRTGDLLGQHGYLNTDPKMDGIFVAWGYGIRSGVRLHRIVNLDVAPTIMASLGLPMPGVAGKVLKSILKGASWDESNRICKRLRPVLCSRERRTKKQTLRSNVKMPHLALTQDKALLLKPERGHEN